MVMITPHVIVPSLRVLLLPQPCPVTCPIPVPRQPSSFVSPHLCTQQGGSCHSGPCTAPYRRSHWCRAAVSKSSPWFWSSSFLMCRPCGHLRPGGPLWLRYNLVALRSFPDWGWEARLLKAIPKGHSASIVTLCYSGWNPILINWCIKCICFVYCAKLVKGTYT